MSRGRGRGRGRSVHKGATESAVIISGPRTTRGTAAVVGASEKSRVASIKPGSTTLQFEEEESPDGATMAAGMSLRPKRNEHPGAVAAPGRKRSSAEVAAEREQRAREEEAQENVRDSTFGKAAVLEDSMQQEDEELLSGHAPQATLIKKVSHTRPESHKDSREIEEGDGESPYKDPVFINDNSSHSDSAYKTGDKNEDDGESEQDILDPSDEESAPRGRSKKKKGSRKENRGKLREEIDARRQVPPESNSIKRKATGLIPASKKAKANDTGIRNDWQEQYVEYLEPTKSNVDDGPAPWPGYDKRSLSHGSAMSISSAVSSHGHSVPASSNVSDREELGGISDDVGKTDERRGLKDNVKPHFSKVKPLAKVEPTISVPEYIHPSIAVKKLKNKQDIRSKSDLPPHLKRDFEGRFLPRLCELLGIIRAWEKPDKNEVLTLWSDIFPDEDLEGWLEIVVFKLIDNAITNWRTKMAQTAIQSFEKLIIPTLPGQSPEDIIEWCTWALSGDYKCRPFYYLSYDEKEVLKGDEKEVIIDAEGVFMHPLISATLAYHFSSISQIHASARLEKRPEGALITAIHACQRVISQYATTGMFIELGRGVGDFSKDNWGDNPTREPKNAPTVLVAEPKSTPNLVRVVKKLSDKQWDSIIDSAMKSIRRQKTITVQAPAVEDAPLEDPESDFEILDNAA